MIEDILLFIGSSQFFIYSINPKRIKKPEFYNVEGGDYQLTDASLTPQVIRIGERRYIIVIFAISLSLCVLLIVEAARMRFWVCLLAWDFMGTRCVVQASAVAGQDVVKEMTKRHSTVRVGT